MAGRAAALARPAAQGAGGHRGACSRRGTGRERELGVSSTARARRASLDGSSARRSRRSAIDFLTALRDNPPPDITRLYWLARVTLVSRARGHPPSSTRCSPRTSRGAPPTVEPRDEEGETAGAASRASDGELQPVVLAEGTGKHASVHDLRNRRDYDATPEDLRELRKALARAPAADPLAPAAARTAAATIDLRRTLRAATRTGEITTLARRDRPHRTRPLLLLIDVSGSLRAHTPDYLRFAWAAQAETFTFGTRLTRITQAAAHARRRRRAGRRRRERSRTPTAARASAPALQEFLDTPRYADRARGALTIVLSDGLERGDPALMAHAVAAPLAALAPAAVVDAARPRPRLPPDHPRDGRDPGRPRRPRRRPRPRRPFSSRCRQL